MKKCEGCDRPVRVGRYTNDDVFLCRSCYAAVPVAPHLLSIVRPTWPSAVDPHWTELVEAVKAWNPEDDFVVCNEASLRIHAAAINYVGWVLALRTALESSGEATSGETSEG